MKEEIAKIAEFEDTDESFENFRAGFLPTNYEAPATAGGYLKVKAGEKHRIRIVGSFKYPTTAIMGWEAWTADNKPVRRSYNAEGFDELTGVDKDNKPRHFWLFQVWHEDQKMAMIWEITQRTIQDAIRAFVDNPSWGDPSKYIITISRTGTGTDTKYNLMPEPPIESPSQEIKDAMLSARIDCRAIFVDENPFGSLVDGDAIPF
tara:strand:- start:42 stop:656 length:615 start_codon:yes stop_codon:yes gene_type:complete